MVHKQLDYCVLYDACHSDSAADGIAFNQCRYHLCFSLNAGEDWQGPTVTKNGRSLRAYPSYDESIKDYLAHLQENPAYGKMFETVTRGSIDRLADAIQRTGYSDDPFYARGIAAVASSPLMKQALWRFDNRPQDRGGDETI